MGIVTLICWLFWTLCLSGLGLCIVVADVMFPGLFVCLSMDLGHKQSMNLKGRKHLGLGQIYANVFNHWQNYTSCSFWLRSVLAADMTLM